MRVVGCALVVLALVAQASAASGSANDLRVAIRYVGTFTSFAYTASSIDANGEATFLSPKTEKWTWSYSWVGKLTVLQQRPPSKFTSESLKGVVKRVDELPGQRTGNCLFTYAARLGTYRLNAPVQVPYRAGKGYAWGEGSITFIQFPPLQASNVAVSSAADLKGNGHCRTFGPSPALAATFPPSMGNVFRFEDLSVFPSTRVRRYDRKFRRPGGRPNEVEFLESSVTLKITKPPR